MRMPGQVKVLHGPDGTAMFEAIAEAFRDAPGVQVDDDLSAVPEAHETAVGVFLLTDDASTDAALADCLERLVQRELPVIPVVPEIAAFDFSALPSALDALRALNALGWDQGETPGEAVFRAIRRHLGLDPFVRHCKVFISYRRADGRDIAWEVYCHLQDRKYQVFLDTEGIEGGEPVQHRIGEEIVERDFLLLIDSPQARESEWILKEMEMALAARVTVCVVRLPGSQGFPLLRDVPAMDWDARDPDRLDRLERFVARAIGAKTTFDTQVDRVMRQVARLEQLELTVRGPRCMMLTRPGVRKCLLVEYEDASLSLDRLYRLYRSYRETRGPCPNAACFIHGGPPLSPLEREAVDWARGRSNLRAVALAHVREAVQEALR